MKKYLDFDEVKAKWAVDKYGLSPNLWKVWKVRGRMPAMYFEDNFEIPIKITKEEEIIYKKIREIYALDELNQASILRLANFEYYKIRDYEAGQGCMYQSDLAVLKKSVNDLRIHIKKTVEPLQNKSVFSDKDIEKVDELLNDPRIFLAQLINNDSVYVNRQNRVHKGIVNASIHLDTKHIINQFVLLLLKMTL